MTVVRGRWDNSRHRAMRQTSEIERLREEILLLREEIRVKDQRMASLAAGRRPHYRAMSRMAILELRSRWGWTVADTGRRFLVEPRTIASWMKRLDEGKERALVCTPTPVNKYPDFIRYLVRRLRTLCPTLGKRKIAEVLARAGLHLGSTTVQRMSQFQGSDSPVDSREVESSEETEQLEAQTITANYPSHVWNLDLTVVPTLAGFWTTLSPFAWLQRWPFCDWIAVVVDHLTRRAIGFAVFLRRPAARDVSAFLGRTIRAAGATPRYVVVTDKGKEFFCRVFKSWCRRRGIRPRYGAVGKPGSIARVERFIRSMKNECTRRIVVPMPKDKLRKELSLYTFWYNHHRPHQALTGCTPDEVYFRQRLANERARYEPRTSWPRNSSCAAPWAKVKGRRGVKLSLRLQYLEGRQHLPVLSLRRVA
jgi:putative transposase